MEKVNDNWPTIVWILFFGFSILILIFLFHFFIAVSNRRDNRKLREELKKRDECQDALNIALRDKVDKTHDLFTDEATKLLNSIQEVIKK